MDTENKMDTYISPLGRIILPLMLERGLNASRLSLMAGLGRTAVRDITEGRSKNPDTRTLNALAAALNVPLETLLKAAPTNLAEWKQEFFDTARAAGHIKAPRSAATVGSDEMPVYAGAQGGPDGMLLTFDVVEMIRRPAPLAKAARSFGMYMTGTSMSPAYEPGDMVLCNASGKPARAGDDVLILKVSEDGTHSALVKRYVKEDDDSLVVEQYNPASQIVIPRGVVFAVHTIVGKYSR